MLNKVLLIGRLTRNPEVRFFPSGTAKTSFSIAYNEKYKDKNDEWKEEPHYFDVETYGALADRLGKTLSKGYQVLIEGRLAQQRWEKDGEKRSKVVIVANRVVILSKPMGSSQMGEQLEDEEDLGIPNSEPEDLASDEDIPF